VKTLALVVAFIIAACRGYEPPPQVESGPSGLAPPTPSVAAPADAQQLKQHMRVHFATISELQRAIARGHLDEAKHLAEWLGTHDEPVPAEWAPYVTELHAAAKEVQAANSLPLAASVAARLGRACSTCHEAQGAYVTFAWEPAPDETAQLASQMKRHQWAAARLWEGLVGPSDELWSEGAGVLSTAHLDTVQAAKGSPRGDVPALAARIRELSTRAVTTTDHDARGTLYGELLSTCAGCHVLVRPDPVPGP